MTTGEPLVEGGVVPAVELVDGQLPDGLAPRRAVVGVAVALVGHPGMYVDVQFEEETFKGAKRHAKNTVI